MYLVSSLDVCSSEGWSCDFDSDGSSELDGGRGVDTDLAGHTLVGQLHGESVVVLLGQAVVTDDFLDLPQAGETHWSAQGRQAENVGSSFVVLLTVCNRESASVTLEG